MLETPLGTLDAGIPTDATNVGCEADNSPRPNVVQCGTVWVMKFALDLIAFTEGPTSDKHTVADRLAGAGFTAAEILEYIDEVMA